MKNVALFVPGFLFGVGLAISGMTNPAKVMAFLDVAGAWDPSLAFVMAGAIATFALLNLLVHRREAPLLGGVLPGVRSHGKPSGRLLIGAALFGAGWGLSGVCPGPAVADLVTLAPGILGYLVAMVVGMVLAQRVFGADAPTPELPAEAAAAPPLAGDCSG